MKLLMRRALLESCKNNFGWFLDGSLLDGFQTCIFSFLILVSDVALLSQSAFVHLQHITCSQFLNMICTLASNVYSKNMFGVICRCTLSVLVFEFVEYAKGFKK